MSLEDIFLTPFVTYLHKKQGLLESEYVYKRHLYYAMYFGAENKANLL